MAASLTALTTLTTLEIRHPNSLLELPPLQLSAYFECNLQLSAYFECFEISERE